MNLPKLRNIEQDFWAQIRSVKDVPQDSRLHASREASWSSDAPGSYAAVQSISMDGGSAVDINKEPQVQDRNIISVHMVLMLVFRE